MRFDIGDDRRAFGAGIDRLTTSADMPAVVRAWSTGDHAPGLAVYRALADMGVTGLLVDVDAGGVGGDEVDVMVALERLGSACCPGPVVDTVAVAPFLVGAGDLARAIASGESIVSAASTALMPRAVDADLCGAVLHVDDGRVTVGSVGAEHRSVDPSRRLFDVTSGAALDAAGHGATADDVARACELGALGTAAYLLGAGVKVLEMSVSHASTRTQFGKPVGSFQAVAHRLADAMIGLELARPLVLGAAIGLRDGTPGAYRDVSAARVACGTAADGAARAALQAHGAIGYTAESDVSLYLLRIRALSAAWGTAAWHRSRIADFLTAGTPS